MATHDYEIANQTASSARTDINNVLQAIATNNSGTSAPSTTFANQWWVDTQNDILYIRNEANTAWIKLGQLNQTSNTFSAQIPAGMVQAYAGSTAPTGWLKCNGDAVSRTTYATLFAAIGTTYGSGDGTSTFNVPELRGEFVRGWDDSRGVDSSRSIGSFQADEFKSHTHTFAGSVASGGSGSSNRDGSRATKTTDPTGGSETRPRNIAMLYCIKF